MDIWSLHKDLRQTSASMFYKPMIYDKNSNLLICVSMLNQTDIYHYFT